MSAYSDRRWAELARELEFTRIPELRRQAEGWRNGLAGLTTLLAVLGVLKGQDSVTELPSWARDTATALLLSAFLSLTAGALLAARAAHGVPGGEILLGGQSLRRWSAQEVSRITRALGWAFICCVSGVALVVSAFVLVWATTGAASTHLTEVRTTDKRMVCGELVGADRQQVSIRTKASGTVHVRQATVVSLRPARSCNDVP
ncbi:hypothetical protein [Streptomyces sp. NPDC093018]|uniref:hypothetical protein n=1 Tax=Streptomyces sp. NPDC093018 TaxID=3155067 RepID=UPI003431D398